MADFIAHHELGRRVMRQAPERALKQIEEYSEVFFWGCQGPDSLFYRKLWQGGGPFHPVAGRIHRENTALFFASMATFAAAQQGWFRNAASAYLYGFVCHYALDSEIHPYVYYLSANGNEKNPNVWPGAIHCQVETDIDMALFHARKGRNIRDFHPSSGYRLPEQHKQLISRMLSSAVRDTYGEFLPPEEIAASFGDTLFFQNLLYRHGREISRIAFALGLINPRLSDFVGNAKISLPAWDCLNLKKRGWRNLDEPGSLRRDSVPEILVSAKRGALNRIRAYEEMLAGGKLYALCYPVSFSNGDQKR